MSWLVRNIHQRKFRRLDKKLRGFLSRTNDAAFLQLAWAVGILQSNTGTDVRPYLNYPAEAATAEITSPYRVNKWEIETLVLLLLTTPKYAMLPGLNRSLDCGQFDSMYLVRQLLRDLENSETAAFLDDSNILMEMHRIGQRQFGWQRGFTSTESLYRFAFIYGQGKCASYFHEMYGLKIEDFLLVSFALSTYLSLGPWRKLPNLRDFKIEPTLLEKVLPLLSRPLADMRTEVKALIENVSAKNVASISYMPSSLRQFPIIKSPQSGKIISPLPDLIMFRATSGLYYDIRSGPQELINEANNRFEQYVLNLIKAFYPRFCLLPGQKYGPKKASLDTPDVLLKDGGQIVVVFECKATKLTYEAQFAENPIEEADKAYTQLIKGITQLWKFFSNARRGIYDKEQVATDAHGVLLTMESWMQMSDKLQGEVIARARKLLKNDLDITEADMRPVVFCSIQDLSDVMFVSSEDELLTTFANAELPKFRGWRLWDVRRETGGKGKQKKFPLKVEELLPWWEQFKPPA